MGYQNENGHRIVFDIETAPLLEAADYLVDPIDAPSNYTDPAKIAAYIDKEKAKQLGKCALDPDLCRVVAIAVWNELHHERPLVTSLRTMSETDLLAEFWLEARRGHLVGFNCGGFDLPVLLRRSLYLGVQAPALRIDKYRHPAYTDLMLLLAFDGLLKFRGLSFYAKRFGCPDIPDPIDGAAMGATVAEGRWHDIEQHVTADVLKTAFIAEKCGLFRPAAAGVF